MELLLSQMINFNLFLLFRTFSSCHPSEVTAARGDRGKKDPRCPPRDMAAFALLIGYPLRP